MISVIVPVYNTEQYLPRCIESILSQSFTDFELLLIDDGSTDGSGAICDEYAKKDYRIRVFHQENRGSAASRQLGFEKAEGFYIAAVDADDWVEANYLESMMDVALKKNADLVVSAYWNNKMGEDTYVANEPQGVDVLSWQSSFLGYHGCHAGLWNKLLRKDLLCQSNVLIPKYDFYEDMVCTISYLQQCRNLSYCPIAAYHYCINDNSLTYETDSSKRIKRFEEMLKNMQDLYLSMSKADRAELEEDIMDRVNSEKIRILEKYPNDYEAYRGLFREWFPKSYSIRKVKGLTTCCRYLALKGIGWPYRLCVAHSR